LASLVEQLQQDALSSAVDVSELLRKAYVAATKLSLDQFRDWCNRELNGYQGPELPEYRLLPGTLRAWNPFNGWIPVFVQDQESSQLLSVHRERGAVSFVEGLVKSGKKDSQLVVRFGSDVQQYFMRQSDVPLEVSLHLSRSSLVALLDGVRNTILEWSLKLEADGILGEGLRFSSNETGIARAKSAELQSVINYGSSQ
jgi:hypothetical protein